MTHLPFHPPTDRKDIDALISHQTDAPCLQGRCVEEGFMAFLVRLYAYFLSKFSDEFRDAGAPAYSPLAATLDGTQALKARLLSSGPYHICMREQPDYACRDGVMVQSVPHVLDGQRTPGWFILWPGALRHRYVVTGAVKSTVSIIMDKLLPLRTSRGVKGVVFLRACDACCLVDPALANLKPYRAHMRRLIPP